MHHRSVVSALAWAVFLSALGFGGGSATVAASALAATTTQASRARHMSRACFASPNGLIFPLLWQGRGQMCERDSGSRPGMRFVGGGKRRMLPTLLSSRVRILALRRAGTSAKMSSMPPDAGEGKLAVGEWGGEREAGDTRDDADCEALAKREAEARREALAAEGKLRTSRKRQPKKRATGDGLRKQIAQREVDPAEIELVARQKVLAKAMELLGKWDEEQEEYTLSRGNSNAPLGDWKGLRRLLTGPEREEMRQACKTLVEDASFVLVGFNAKTEQEARTAMDQWITELCLPPPIKVELMDDDMSQKYESRDVMPPEVISLFDGPIHIAYNSKAGADKTSGDDSNAPAMAVLMPYPANDRGVVFTPILEGFFTQYGDIPLNLFNKEADDEAATGIPAPEEEDPDVVLKQHASMGNEEAAKELRRKEAERAMQARERAAMQAREELKDGECC